MSNKFYWIKLKTDFFNQDTIDFLLSQENGCKYVVLYQMLCLNTANSDGKLITNIGEMIVPYDIEKIVRDCKYFDYDTIVVALELFKRLGLIYEEENKILRISNIDRMVGSESASKYAIKKREQRLKNKIKSKEIKIGTQRETNCLIEYRDKSIEYRDKSIDNNKKKILKEKENEKFEIFYQSYPRKVAKENTKKWFLKNNPDDVLFKKIMDSLEEHKKLKQWQDKQFIPHPTTWLNQKRWEDEIEIEDTNKIWEEIEKELKEESE